MNNRNTKKRKTIDERMMRELREREWQKELLAAKNRHKCKYYVAIEIAFFLFLVYVLYKSILIYLGFKMHQKFGFADMLLRKDFKPLIFRCFPLALGVSQIVFFIFFKMGFFRYREKAEKYKCSFFYYSFKDELYERLIWLEHDIIFVNGIFLIILQLIVDYFFSLQEYLWPFVIFYIFILFLMPFLLRPFILSLEREEEFPPHLQDIDNSYLWDEAGNLNDKEDDIFHE